VANGIQQRVCANCGALDNYTYAGNDTGVWQVRNADSAAINVPVSIQGLSGQTVTMVYTNDSATTTVDMSAVTLSQVGLMRSSLMPETAADPLSAVKTFNSKGWSKLTSKSTGRGLQQRIAAVSLTIAPGATRTVYLYNGEQRTVTLARQQTTSDGTLVNAWVDQNEYTDSKVGNALAQTILSSYADPSGIYDKLKSLGGPMWGPNAAKYSGLIAASNQPIDLFLVNIDRNGQPYNVVGFFYALNSFQRAAGDTAYSNESLGLFIDTETLYLAGADGVRLAKQTLAHEGMHMQNFYRRALGMGDSYAYDTWLDEMTAMMAEDWVASSIDSANNPIRDTRMTTYLNWQAQGAYNCSLFTWTPMGSSCESYGLAGSFGGFLNRQLGLAFYKDLLTQNTANSQEALDASIKRYRAGSSLVEEMRNFETAAAGGVPYGANIPAYRFDARDEGGFSLVSIDPAGYPRAMPTSLPAQLAPLGSFPVKRSNVTGTFYETVSLKPGTSVTVVVR
jgi:hypothetical protein